MVRRTLVLGNRWVPLPLIGKQKTPTFPQNGFKKHCFVGRQVRVYFSEMASLVLPDIHPHVISAGYTFHFVRLAPHPGAHHPIYPGGVGGVVFCILVEEIMRLLPNIVYFAVRRCPIQVFCAPLLFPCAFWRVKSVRNPTNLPPSPIPSLPCSPTHRPTRNA